MIHVQQFDGVNERTLTTLVECSWQSGSSWVTSNTGTQH